MINNDTEFERCHRISKQSNQDLPRTVIWKAIKIMDKQKILKNAKYLKNTGIFIYEVFCKDTMELRKNYGIKYWNIVGK